MHTRCAFLASQIRLPDGLSRSAFYRGEISLTPDIAKRLLTVLDGLVDLGNRHSAVLKQTDALQGRVSRCENHDKMAEVLSADGNSLQN